MWGGGLAPGREFSAMLVGQRYTAGDPVQAILADLDRGFASVTPIDLPTRPNAIDRVAERAGGAGADSADDLVHPAAARCDECALRVEYAFQAIGAEAGVLANTAVVEHGDSDPGIRVALVCHTLGVLLLGETYPRTGSVAQGLMADSPQRQSAIWGRVAISSPSQFRIRVAFVTR